MGRTIIQDEGSYEGESFRWELTKHFYTPDTSKLPDREKEYFESAISLLTGKEIRTSNIRKEWLYYYFIFKDYILTLTWYPMLVPPEYINKEIASFLNELGLPMSIDAIGTLEGPLSHTRQSVKQTVTAPPD